MRKGTLDPALFCEIMDDFLKDMDVGMVIEIPEGTLEAKVTDNVHCGSLVRYYILLSAIRPIVAGMREELDDIRGDELMQSIDQMLSAIRGRTMTAIEEEECVHAGKESEP